MSNSFYSHGFGSSLIPFDVNAGGRGHTGRMRFRLLFRESRFYVSNCAEFISIDATQLEEGGIFWNLDTWGAWSGFVSRGGWFRGWSPHTWYSTGVSHYECMWVLPFRGSSSVCPNRSEIIGLPRRCWKKIQSNAIVNSEWPPRWNKV